MKGNNQVRLGVEAPKSVAVHREEIFERIKRERALGCLERGNCVHFEVSSRLVVVWKGVLGRGRGRAGDRREQVAAYVLYGLAGAHRLIGIQGCRCVTHDHAIAERDRPLQRNRDAACGHGYGIDAATRWSDRCTLRSRQRKRRGRRSETFRKFASILSALSMCAGCAARSAKSFSASS